MTVRIATFGGCVDFVFDIGETAESKVFLDRNPEFFPAFEKLAVLINKSFARSFQPKFLAEDICFGLGATCRDDFTEILFLGINGYATGALKLLRGLYERAVALAYIVKHPEKADRFVRYAGIQEFKAMNTALKIVNEADFNAAMGPDNTTAKIRERYEMVKPEFQTTLCKECGHRGTAFSWDRDLVSMVRTVGPKFEKLFLSSYTIPNLHVHATYASIEPERAQAQDERDSARRRDADVALLNATAILVLVIEAQNTMFGLHLEKEIAACEQDIPLVWHGLNPF